MKIKTFIINRDLLTWPKAMVEWINNHPDLEPIILDNASTYAPLLEWYDTDPCRVIKMPTNYGHTVLWSSGVFHKELKNDPYYILTDPDLDLTTVPHDVVDKMIEGLNKYNLPKIGLAIRIDDIPDGYILKDQVLKWETPFWHTHVGDYYYKSPIDTTFALHSTEKCRGHMIGGMRIGGIYTTRHLPFYLTEDTITEEFQYFCNHANLQVSTQARYLLNWVNSTMEKRSAC